MSIVEFLFDIKKKKHIPVIQTCRGCFAKYESINLKSGEITWHLWQKGIECPVCRRCGHLKPHGMDFS